MPIFRWKAVDRFLALAFAACCQGSVFAAAGGDWFGPACQYSQEFPPLVPVGQQVLLLQAYTSPDESDTVSVLRTNDGALWVSAETLHEWRLTPPVAFMMANGSRWYALARIASLRYRYDDCTQSLWLDTSGLAKTLSVFSVPAPDQGDIKPLSLQSGGYLNLDAQYVSAGGQHLFSTLPAVVVFSQLGYGTANAVVDKRGVHRLDTNWNIDDADHLLRLTAGDSITRSSTFGQSLRFGGIQWGRAFGLRPDLITFPQPALRGNAALPSTVDVYVNQALRGQQSVPSGPFELTQVPVTVGQGQVQLVTRDALGRESISSYPIYASQALLRQGLDDFTFEAGWERLDYGATSADYGRFLTAATWRRGLADDLTMELRAEEGGAAPGLSTAATMLWPDLGVFNVGLAASRGGDGFGGSYVFGFQRIASVWSLSLEARRADHQYRRLGGEDGDIRARDLASIGVNLGAPGSLSFTGLRQRRDGDGETDIYSLGWSFNPLQNLYANLNLIHSSNVAGSDRQALLVFSYNFGGNLFAGGQFLRDQSSGSQAQFTLQKAADDVLGTSYQATTGLGPSARHGLQAQWSQEKGTLSGEFDQVAGQRGYRAGYSTGLAWQGTSAFWTRPITGNFTVVDTQGVPDVPVFADEHFMGRTDTRGILLVPNMRPYEINRLRIDDSDLSMRYQVDSPEQTVRLPLRGSSRVVFPVKQNLDLILRLHLPTGDVVPAGASIVFGGGVEGLPVGFNGKVYIEDAQLHRRLTARWSGHSCEARWTRPASAGRTINAVCKEVGQ